MNKKNNAADYDAAMRSESAQFPDLAWYDPFEPPLQLSGLHWNREQRRYRRMPVNDGIGLSEAVDGLANHSAGVQLRFCSNSTSIVLKVELAQPAGMVHMPATGQCGCDIYVKHQGRFIFYGVTKYDVNADNAEDYEIEIYTQDDDTEQEYLVHFPLYQEVKSMYLGLKKEATLRAPTAFALEQPIVIYGTSITQGGCATRPGMAHTNILSRDLNAEIYNLGFSGSGKGEPEVATAMASIDNVAMFILDYEANVRCIAETMETFVSILRQSHAIVPILIVSSPPRSSRIFKQQERQRLERESQWQENFVQKQQEQGDKNIYFLDGCTAIQDVFEEATVDGIHPTDLGFQLIAQLWKPQIESILGQI